MNMGHSECCTAVYEGLSVPCPCVSFDVDTLVLVRLLSTVVFLTGDCLLMQISRSPHISFPSFSSHLASGMANHTWGILRRVTIRGHCYPFFETNSVTWTSTKSKNRCHPSASLELPMAHTRHKMWVIWGKTFDNNWIQYKKLVVLKGTIMLFLLHGMLSLCASSNIANTHTHRWSSPLGIIQKHCPVSLQTGWIWGFGLCLLFALFPLQTRYLMPVVAPTVVLNIRA